MVMTMVMVTVVVVMLLIYSVAAIERPTQRLDGFLRGLDCQEGDRAETAGVFELQRVPFADVREARHGLRLTRVWHDTTTIWRQDH